MIHSFFHFPFSFTEFGTFFDHLNNKLLNKSLFLSKKFKIPQTFTCVFPRTSSTKVKITKLMVYVCMVITCDFTGGVWLCQMIHGGIYPAALFCCFSML